MKRTFSLNAPTVSVQYVQCVFNVVYPCKCLTIGEFYVDKLDCEEDI